MSGEGYGYHYPPGVQSFPLDPTQYWSEWSLEQQQYNNSVRSAVQHQSNPLSHTNNHSNSYAPPSRPQDYYDNSRYYQQRRFNNPSQPFPGNQQTWQRNNYNKRPRPQGENAEPRNKAVKKKKPLSQNVPSRKDWTLEEAEMALSVEKEYNKRYKNHSLIIKFPDLELNRDIVTKFHPSIENVHFQQPSTPRFCFVTLQESADAEMVISSLNKIKFGDGYLTVEYKKDREEDQNIGPEDIDPCTLYVGNLAQEITKEDMVKTYPKGRRIDIGYAKKMKYTRYAFVSFKNVSDSIEAFKKTHNTQMYSKSLIVRFRRLHGTVGMPGEPKPQSPEKKTDTNSTNEDTSSERDGHRRDAVGNLTNSTNEDTSSERDGHRRAAVGDLTNSTNEDTSSERDGHRRDAVGDLTNEEDTVVTDTNLLNPQLDLTVVKQEIDSSDEELVTEINRVPKSYVSPFLPGSINLALKQHRPMIKKEIKQEVEIRGGTPLLTMAIEDETNVQASVSVETSLSGVKTNGSKVHIKNEPKNDGAGVKRERNEEDSGDDCVGEIGDVNFSSLINDLEGHSNLLESLRKSVP